MTHKSDITLGFLAGIGAGAAAALLLAPRSGQETREQLKGRVQEARTKAQQKMHEQADRMKERLNKAADTAKDTIDQGQEAADKAADKVQSRTRRNSTPGDTSIL
ncbi:MAG TPA: YtxH domain-containing protein [Candidatus Saccharimonadales bacterium]|nr:YtxH domain-containing protein [Candidatus Saccharimonadales bacterium]